MPLDQSRTQITGARSESQTVICDWADGHQSQFAAIALRHHCECAICGSAETGVRGIRIGEIAADIHAQSAEALPDQLNITWSDGHQSVYQADWLRAHCASDSERAARRHKPILWDGTLGDAMPLADFEEVERDPAARLKMLLDVCDYGVCKIVNAPTDAAEKLRMINLVGPQRITNHGTFTLSGKKAVDNVGDTTIALDPHTDECYRLSAIGITVFQVLRPASTGGDTTLIDGFEVARRLKETSPEDFDLLTKAPITCHRIEGGRNAGREKRRFSSRLPVIQLDGDGEVVGFRLNERQIAPLDLPQDMIATTYQALRNILKIAYDPSLMLEMKLKAGEGLLFDNQRALHGRTGFQAENPPVRSVLTSSVDLDDFYSTIRMLRADLNAPEQPSKFGQGMAG